MSSNFYKKLTISDLHRLAYPTAQFPVAAATAVETREVAGRIGGRKHQVKLYDAKLDKDYDVVLYARQGRHPKPVLQKRGWDGNNGGWGKFVQDRGLQEGEVIQIRKEPGEDQLRVSVKEYNFWARQEGSAESVAQ